MSESRETGGEKPNIFQIKTEDDLLVFSNEDLIQGFKMLHTQLKFFTSSDSRWSDRGAPGGGPSGAEKIRKQIDLAEAVLRERGIKVVE